jgi:dolichol-phosphate mannosyltransferase
MASEAPQCCIVMPAYDEAASLQAAVDAWLAVVDRSGITPARLLIVDDGSRDETPRIADALAAGDSRVAVHHQANAGHGPAILEGYRRALAMGARFVFQTDSDQQMLPDDFPALWARRDAAGLVLGVRTTRRDPAVRRLLSAALRLALRGLFGVSVRDANAPFRLFAAPYLAAAIGELPESMIVPNVALSVLAARDGRLLEMPVRHEPRRSGHSVLVGVSLLRFSLRSATELLRLRRTQATRRAPGDTGHR